MQLLTDVDKNFLEEALRIYRLCEKRYKMVVANPLHSNDYIYMFESGINKSRYQIIPPNIRSYGLNEERAEACSQEIRESLSDDTGKINLLNLNREGVGLPPFSLVKAGPRYSFSSEYVLYCSEIYLLLLRVNKVIKYQENRSKTEIDDFLDKELLVYFEDLYYLTLHALMLMKNNETRG